MRKNILIFLFGLLGLAFPQSARGQFIGYTAPQTVQQTLATNAACTGGQQNFPVNNLGQIQHSVQMTNLGVGITNLLLVIQGSADGVNFINISDVSNGTLSVSVSAPGYYPVVRVGVICGPVAGGSTFSLSYSGIAGFGQQSTGLFLLSQIDKQLASAVPANAIFSNTVQPTPYGSAGGVLNFLFSNTAPSGTTLAMTCKNASGNIGWQSSFSLATAATVQTFYIPAVPCPNFQVTYTPNGATAVTFQLDYIFSPPGSAASATQYTHVTTTTATAAKATSGFLHTLNVNTAAAGTISIFDLATAACTGTPATNVVAVITVPAATNGLPTFTYDVNLLNGICVKASVAMDYTVSTN